MNKLLCTVIAALLAISAAQARELKVMPPPVTAAGKTHIVAYFTDKDAKVGNSVRSMSSNNAVLYEQNFGGGGAVVGAMFGVLGVLGNTAAIANRTNDQAKELFDKLPIDPTVPAAQALAANGVSIELLDSADVTVRASLNVISTDEVNCIFSVTLLAEYPAAGKKKGPAYARYVYQLRSVYPRARLVEGLRPEEIATLRQDAAEGFAELAWLYAADSRNELANASKVTFRAAIINPRFDVAFDGMLVSAARAGRFTVRLPGAVYSIPSERVTRS
jgi:hypothetical protein